MKQKANYLTLVPVLILGVACGRAAGTEPHDASAAQHDAAADEEDSQASAHADRHDPGASEDKKKCNQGKGRVCWTDQSNPTDEHLKHAAEHRELAAQHRTASQALRDAEARACSGLTEEDRDMSPFSHVADIRSVAELKGEMPAKTGKTKVQRTVGATIVLDAVPGLTQEWLQKIVDCHLARSAAVGHEMSEMPYCPLVPRGAEAKVRSVGDGFAVDVRADDQETATEILRRAQGLKTAEGAQ